MKTKQFDCVEMKRQGAMRVHERLKGLTVQQQIEYWRQQTEALRQRQEAVRRANAAPLPKDVPGQKR